MFIFINVYTKVIRQSLTGAQGGRVLAVGRTLKSRTVTHILCDWR
ncbi:MAG: hypothetical protein WAT78_01490 [Rhizobiaceae bacterium]